MRRDRYECERCGHEIYNKGWGTWLHWDEDDWYGGDCVCADGDDECVAILTELSNDYTIG